MERRERERDLDTRNNTAGLQVDNLNCP